MWSSNNLTYCSITFSSFTQIHKRSKLCFQEAFKAGFQPRWTWGHFWKMADLAIDLITKRLEIPSQSCSYDGGRCFQMGAASVNKNHSPWALQKHLVLQWSGGRGSTGFQLWGKSRCAPGNFGATVVPMGISLGITDLKSEILIHGIDPIPG